MDETNIFYLQVYNAARRSWVTISPYRYVWDTTPPAFPTFHDSCPATRALGSLARNNPGQFRVAVTIDGTLQELVQARGQGASRASAVQSGGKKKCCG